MLKKKGEKKRKKHERKSETLLTERIILGLGAIDSAVLINPEKKLLVGEELPAANISREVAVAADVPAHHHCSRGRVVGQPGGACGPAGIVALHGQSREREREQQQQQRGQVGHTNPGCGTVSHFPCAHCTGGWRTGKSLTERYMLESCLGEGKRPGGRAPSAQRKCQFLLWIRFPSRLKGRCQHP